MHCIVPLRVKRSCEIDYRTRHKAHLLSTPLPLLFSGHAKTHMLLPFSAYSHA